MKDVVFQTTFPENFEATWAWWAGQSTSGGKSNIQSSWTGQGKNWTVERTNSSKDNNNERKFQYKLSKISAKNKEFSLKIKKEKRKMPSLLSKSYYRW